MASWQTESRLARIARMGLIGLTTLACAMSPAATPTPAPSTLTPAPSTPTPGPATSAGPTVVPAATPTPTPAPLPTPSAAPTPSGLTGRIAYYCGAICIVDADGTGLIELPVHGFAPAWSPDGSRLAFWTVTPDSDFYNEYDIFVTDRNGNGLTQLTDHRGLDGQPAWSPDGRRIAFISYRDGDPEVYIMDADGANQVNLTRNHAAEWGPAWSPDGSRIAFTSDRHDPDGGVGDIYVMNADGSDWVDLTNSPAADEWNPAWSPDGTRIAFESNRDGSFQIYVMNADGSNLVRLTNDDGRDTFPAWSPDGAHIAFTHETRPFWDSNGSDGEINLMDADGANQMTLTNYRINFGWEPAWMPVLPAPAQVPAPPVPPATPGPTPAPTAGPTRPPQSVPEAPLVDPADDWGPYQTGAFWSRGRLWIFVWASGIPEWDYFCVGYGITECPIYVHWLEPGEDVAGYRVYTAPGVLSASGLSCSTSQRQLLAELGTDETGLRAKVPMNLFVGYAAGGGPADVTCLVVTAFNAAGESAGLQDYLIYPLGV